MAEGIGASGDTRFQEALDTCLAALRRGDSVERCLNLYPALAEHLRPLLTAAAHLLEDSRALPPATAGRPALLPPGFGGPGRARFMAAVAAARTAAERRAVVDQRSVTGPVENSIADGTLQSLPVTEALDRAVGHVLAGGTTDTVVPRELAGLIAPLLTVVTRLRADTVPAPASPMGPFRTRFISLATALAASSQDESRAAHASGVESEILERFGQLVAAAALAPPPANLGPGRDRLLAAAAATRPDATLLSSRPDRAGLLWAPRLRAFRQAFAAPARAAGSRVAVGVAVAAAVLLGNAFVLAPAAAAALPGEALYSVKLLGERVSLAVTLDAAARDELRAAFSHRRSIELSAATADGATGNIEDWAARFVDAQRMERNEGSEGEDLGEFRVITRGENSAPITTTLAWNARTTLDLGKEISDLTALTRGSEVRLWVRLRGADKVALAYKVSLVAMAEPVPTPTPALPTETSAPPTTEASMTPADSPTPPASPTVRISTATATPVDTATPPPVQTSKSPEPSEPRLSGILLSEPSDVVWDLRETETDHRGRTTSVDVAYIVEKGDVPEGLRKGNSVILGGRWADEAHSRFVARTVLDFKSDPCTQGDVLGLVDTYIDGQSLTLQDGSRFVVGVDAPPTVAGGAVTPGVRVKVVYEDCGYEDRFLRSIEVLPAVRPVLVQGTVSELDLGGGRLVLVDTIGIAGPLTVRFDPAAISARLAVGQVLEIEGELVEPGVVRAEQIRVMQEAPATPGALPTTAGDGPVNPGTATPGIEPPSTTRLSGEAGLFAVELAGREPARGSKWYG